MRKFYCSKFVAWTYNSVSDKDSIPQYPSKLQGNNKNFIAALGVPSSARYTFAPSDIELDSMFDIIYEYRNPGLTAQSRLEELVVDKVLYWIRTEGLEISPSTLTERGAKVAIKVYQIPSIRRVLNSLNMHLNPNLDPKFLSVGITMKLLVESIRAKVEKLVKNSVTGVYSSPSEIYQMIDEARLETPNFARLLKPRKQNACMRFYTSYNVR